MKKFGVSISPVFMSWGINSCSFVFILVINIILLNWHPLTGSFLAVLLTASIMDTLATILYIKAIKNGDLSKTIPMLCFVPVVQLFVTPVLVNENLSVTGMAGVLIVVSGSYILNVDQWNKLLSPFRVLLTEKSTMMMLAVAVIWGVSSSFHKIGVRQTDALFWGAAEIGAISLLLFPLTFWSGRNDFSFPKIQKTVIPAVFSTMTVLSYYTAISLGPVAYVSSVRRLGIMFSMLAGIYFLKERLKPLGFAGGIIMIAGALVITLFG